MPSTVRAEIGPTGRKIWVTFRYSPRKLDLIKSVPGRTFIPEDKGGPAWSVPLDLPTARVLRAKFGDDLILGKELTKWGRSAVKEEKHLTELSLADDINLERLPSVLPSMYKILRDYQKVGIKFAAESRNPLIADQPGLGKTLEAIGAVFEAGLENGPHLVLGLLTSLESVWLKELLQWQSFPVLLATGTKDERLNVLEHAAELDEPFWLIANHEMGRYRSVFESCDNHFADEPVSVLRRCDDCIEIKKFEYPIIHKIQWNSMIIDECVKAGIRNPNSIGSESLSIIRAKKIMALTGTPMGGKALNLWGLLHFLRPEIFTSRWNWAGQWLEITDDDYGKQVGDIREDSLKEFSDHLRPYMIRREKVDVVKELPPKQFVDIWCDMSAKQRKQYEKFAADAEIKIEEEQLSATSILAEYTRLKQFASAYCTIENGRLIPSPDSGKLAALMDLLDERGILDNEGDQQVVIFSQFRPLVDLISDHLAKKGVKVGKITGKVKNRAELQNQFQGKNLRVMVMTTTSGGVAITLDQADTVIILDETWDPDDQEQAADRVHRVSRIHQVTVYTLRTKGTIEEYIMEVNVGKENVNASVLKRVRLR